MVPSCPLFWLQRGVRDGRWERGAEGWKLRPPFGGNASRWLDGNVFGESIGVSLLQRPAALLAGPGHGQQQEGPLRNDARLRGASRWWQRHHPSPCQHPSCPFPPPLPFPGALPVSAVWELSPFPRPTSKCPVSPPPSSHLPLSPPPRFTVTR